MTKEGYLKLLGQLLRPAGTAGEKGFAIGWHKGMGKSFGKNRSFFGRQKFFRGRFFDISL